MKINHKTKISKVIKENKEAIEVIASLNSHFTKLRNPVLRKMLAPRVSIAEAARIGKCEVNEMLEKLEPLGFEIEKIKEEENNSGGNDSLKLEERNQFIEGFKVFTFDVRPYLEKGEDPLKHIQKTIKKLTPNDVLEILINFEPIPLIRIEERNGFETLTVVEDEVYHTYFKMGKEVKDYSKVEKELSELYQEVEAEELEKIRDSFNGEWIHLDVRDLEMPQPMMKILEAVGEMEENQGLDIQHKRIPQFLLPELKPYNLEVFIHPIEEGNVKMLILPKNV